MPWHADLHVHSKYSRATSRDLDLEHLAYWACRKGIAVVATGDFTHPAWFAELKDKLVPAEPGLFRLRPDVERWVTQRLPAACHATARFMLSVEISTIYKKGDRTRKVHHLLYAPDFETAERIAQRLARIGNIASDGRPILGLDSRDLLEITLESGPGAYLVPAHIWTPWFAALGSQSGFDSIAECYGDLADHIFAVETGLSSDPPMNWRLSLLDRYRLVSHSDAHSPGKLGREATMFECDVDYFAIRRALEAGAGYVGTVEFFPEEGKYHLDGHRKCGVRLTPAETAAHEGRCPGCRQPVTVGVLHRVETLADRPLEATTARPATAGTVKNLVPLHEVLSEILGIGPSTKTVGRAFDALLARLGPELSILQSVPVDDIARSDVPLLDEALARLRADRVICEAGYDGEYGVIRLFDEAELQRLKSGGLLIGARPPAESSAPARGAAPKAPRAVDDHGAQREEGHHPSEHAGRGDPIRADSHPRTPPRRRTSATREPDSDHVRVLDDDQRAAVEAADGPILIVAGPGSGKTRVLTHRIAHLVADRGVPASACLAITFTRRAAAEMRERLAVLVPMSAGELPIHTFHSLGLDILREHGDAAGVHPGFRVADEAERAEVLADTLGISEARAVALLRDISTAKRAPRRSAGDVERTDFSSQRRARPVADNSSPHGGEAGSGAAVIAYRNAMRARNWVDFDDLIVLTVEALAANPSLAALYRDRYRWISVDEFQDVDEVQYRLLTLLAPPAGRPDSAASGSAPTAAEPRAPDRANLCVIGDPDQSIYGFRGADASCFDRFRRDYAGATVVRLARNYRSTGTIVSAASQMIAASPVADAVAEAVREMQDRITIHAAQTERAEAEFVVQTIERLIGGHSFFSIDTGRATGAAGALGFADFAVLFRTDAQAAALDEALARSGIPFRKATRDLIPAGALGRDRSDDGAASPSEADLWDPRADRVALLSLHAAKGLEFRVVFIVGVEDGILPLYWGKRDHAGMAEERRVFYVGMTRARDQLILSYARRRRWRGRVQVLPPSPFLGDIERALVQQSTVQPMHRAPDGDQLGLF